jgi:glucokinase
MASILSMEHTTQMSYEEVFKKAKEGNRLCQDTVDKTMDYLSLGIANIISILNPEALIIGGRMFRKNIDLLELIKDRVNRLTPVKSIIIPTDLRDRSGIMGCIATVISNMYGIKLF